MELSPYLKFYPNPDNPETALAFSTKKASIALLPVELIEELKKGRVPEGVEETLVALGVLMESAEAERADALAYLEQVNQTSPVVNVSVILGMACNFDCKYCYEGSLKGSDAMSCETADRLIGFVADRLVPGKTKLILDFYGGEPLLYTERIRQIAGGLRQVADERSARFSFTLVTNGSLLTREVVEELLPLGLTGAKITLDGPADNHDRFRPFKSGKGSFEAIVENVKATWDLVQIGVGGNFTRDNYKRFTELLDTLEAEGLGPKELAEVQFAPAMQTTDPSSNAEFIGGCASINEPWVVDATLVLREEVMKRGHKVPKIQPSPCIVDLTDAFTVHWDGTLTKCPGLIGREDLVVGNLWKGFEDYSETFHTVRFQQEDECRECVYLPLCFGGCRYMKYERDGTMGGVDCMKEFHEATLEKLLRQEVKYRLGA